MKTLVQRYTQIRHYFYCVVLCLLLVSSSSLPLFAQIVYSARYYYPPYAHRFSYYHIYLLNPHINHRQQITFGHWDDFDANYSPNGRYIAFDRIKQHHHDYEEEWLCVYSIKRSSIVAKQKENINTVSDTYCWNSNGSAVSFSDCKPLIVEPKIYSKGFFLFDPDKSPHGRFSIRWPNNDDHTIQIWRDDGNTLLLKLSSKHHVLPFWSEEEQLYCYLLMNYGNGQRIELDHIDPNASPPSQKKVLVHLAPNDPFKKWFQFDGDQYSISFGGGSGIPGQSILAEDFSISSYRELAYFLVNTHTGLTQFLGYGSSISFSANSKEYITVTKRWLAHYGKHRVLWISRLILHSVVHKTSNVLVEGLVEVESASWLKGYDCPF